MNPKNLFVRLGLALLALLLVGGLVAVVGNRAYTAGLYAGAQQAVAAIGQAENGPAAPVAPFGYNRMNPRGGWDNHTMNGGFFGPLMLVGGVLGFIFKAVLLVALIALLVRVFMGWRHRQGGGPGGGPRAMFDEWHKQAHATDTPPANPPTTA